MYNLRQITYILVLCEEKYLMTQFTPQEICYLGILANTIVTTYQHLLLPLITLSANSMLLVLAVTVIDQGQTSSVRPDI